MLPLRRVLLPLAFMLGVSAPVGAQQSALAVPEIPGSSLGFNQDRLARIDSVFNSAVERGEVAGVVALVLQDGQPVYEKAFGWADREARRQMTASTIFRIASQTKAITSVAVMALAEQGKLSISDPVSRFIPAFERTTVAVRGEGGRNIVPARRQITIRDLLTHTAGISYGTDSLVAPLYGAAGLGPEAGFGWYTADKNEPICTTMERLATIPFVAQPGERFVYGYNTDVLGCVVERASGIPLDEFIRRTVTEPLQMNDTHFFLPAQKQERLASVYTVGADGKVMRAPEGSRGQGSYVDGPRRSFAGGAGLLSTAHDYSRFLQMMLNGGELDGQRILGPKTVALMTTNQVGTLYSPDGEGFGLGFRIVERPGARGRIESVGTYGWSGAYGTEYMIDPQERLVLVFMVQEVPNRSRISQRFPMLVYQALTEPR